MNSRYLIGTSYTFLDKYSAKCKKRNFRDLSLFSDAEEFSKSLRNNYIIKFMFG